MKRRKRSGIHPGVIFGIILAVAGLILFVTMIYLALAG